MMILIIMKIMIIMINAYYNQYLHINNWFIIRLIYQNIWLYLRITPPFLP